MDLDEDGCADRTLKFLLGVAHGIWIVGFDWVLECEKKHELVCEDEFEALDVDQESGPRRSRVDGLQRPFLKISNFVV